VDLDVITNFYILDAILGGTGKRSGMPCWHLIMPAFTLSTIPTGHRGAL